jgi:hypothetical protein
MEDFSSPHPKHAGAAACDLGEAQGWLRLQSKPELDSAPGQCRDKNGTVKPPLGLGDHAYSNNLRVIIDMWLEICYKLV